MSLKFTYYVSVIFKTKCVYLFWPTYLFMIHLINCIVFHDFFPQQGCHSRHLKVFVEIRYLYTSQFSFYKKRSRPQYPITYLALMLLLLSILLLELRECVFSQNSCKVFRKILWIKSYRFLSLVISII